MATEDMNLEERTASLLTALDAATSSNFFQQEQKEVYLLPAELGTPNKQPANYFCNTLTASTSTHGGFSVPRRATEKVLTYISRIILINYTRKQRQPWCEPDGNQESYTQLYLFLSIVIRIHLNSCYTLVHYVLSGVKGYKQKLNIELLILLIQPFCKYCKIRLYENWTRSSNLRCSRRRRRFCARRGSEPATNRAEDRAPDPRGRGNSARCVGSSNRQSRQATYRWEVSIALQILPTKGISECPLLSRAAAVLFFLPLVFFSGSATTSQKRGQIRVA
ncbi:hypothetical protein RJT34_00132 [Clitoria ternatea]|uniref:Uncharacterized protein n=1 Tax=Clitoria ternatea TaxID=43366 RepID=A0AAN9KEX7_CLITE